VGLPDLAATGGKIQAYLGPINNDGNWEEGIWTSESGLPTHSRGKHIACFDADGDGYSDLLTYSNGMTLVFWGPYLNSQSEISREGKIFEIGDISNDGITDFIIGDHLFNGNSGRTYGIGYSMETTDSASSLPDINGDGYKDFVTGFKNYNNGIFGSGIVHILLGGPYAYSYWDEIAPSTFTNHFGQSVASGDVDGDGSYDILVGSPGHNSDQGAIFVYFGSDFSTYRLITKDQAESSVNFGTNIIGEFDLNSDNRADLISQEPGNFWNPQLGSFHSLYDEF